MQLFSLPGQKTLVFAYLLSLFLLNGCATSSVLEPSPSISMEEASAKNTIYDNKLTSEQLKQEYETLQKKRARSKV